jgi:transposase
MTKRVEKRTIGVDVAKRWLDIHSCADKTTVRIDNDAASIEAWLKDVGGPARLAVEATNRFHEAVVHAAHRHGHHVYVVDALKLARYRDAIGGRAKTDRQDAELLARYLTQERAHLRRWQPPDPRQERLWRLLKRRATLVKTATQLRQSLADLETLDAAAQDLIRHCQELIHQVERALQAQARQLGWGDDLQRSRGVPGVGPITSLALVTTFKRHDFHSADAFIAYMGLDVRVRDSGTLRGRRKLSKKGDPELRRLLYNAAMAACRQPHWKSYYRSLRDRGFSGTAALVAVSRKLARVCYALLQKQTSFNPEFRTRPCMST